MNRFVWKMNSLYDTYSPGQNVLGHLRKLGTQTHFANLTHILPLKNAWGCCYKGLFLLSPSPPSSVDCVELKLEYITSTLHRGGRGEGRCLNLTSYCVSVPRVLTRVVWKPPSIGKRVLNITKLRERGYFCCPPGSTRSEKLLITYLCIDHYSQLLSAFGKSKTFQAPRAKLPC